VEVDSPSTAPADTSLAARLISWLGRTVSWLTLLMTLATFAIVLLRYGFNLGWIWMQESVTYLHATVFMVAAAWTLQTDDHVRVDIFYRERSPRYRLWLNFAGTLLFLVPFSIFLVIIGWDYVASAWKVKEASSEPGGLPLVWLLKSLVLILPLMLLMQAGVTLAQCVSGLRGQAREG
jgi:TRAP-type mannitol/chloroaromatic compound transport system permease small subunit